MKLVFRCWLGVFYLTWAIWIVASDQLMVVASHWPIACSMALGSFFAGSTPMGGGSIGFPVLVLWMQEASSLGRDFSFAIQSIGMVSASLYILSMRQPLQWRLLRGAMLGTLVGTPLGLLYLSPLIPSLWVKVVFSVLWGAFGIFHLIRLSSLAAAASGDNLKRAAERETGFVLGLIGGGTVAALTGVGVDMLIYMVMILWLRTDLRVAIPTSVLLMAMTSVIGLATQWLMGELDHAIWPHWSAAAPVVAIGAPLGAWSVSKIKRSSAIGIVSMLCVLQFAWLLFSQAGQLGRWGLLIVLLSLVALVWCYLMLYGRWQPPKKNDLL
jgi:uncharacterized membrane protein YfcA